MDVVKMFEPVTKWATTVIHPDTIPEIVRKAVRIARTEKPGAVLIELPENVAKQDAEHGPMTPRRFRQRDVGLAHTGPERQVSAAAAKRDRAYVAPFAGIARLHHRKRWC